MAADVTLSMEMRNDTVIKSMRQVGAESEKLSRKAQQQSGKAKGYAPGMGILETSRLIEDAQYGMRGVLNNIPGLIMSFGGGMGLAGVVSIAAVAVSVLGKGFLELAMGADTTAKDMESLKKRTEEYEGAVKAAKDRQAEFLKSLKDTKEEARVQAAIQETIRRLGDPVGQSEIAADRERRTRAARDRLEALRVERDALMGVAGTTAVSDPMRDAEADAAAAAKVVADLQKRQAEIQRLIETGQQGATPEQMSQQMLDIETSIAAAKSKMDGFNQSAENSKNRAKELANSEWMLMFGPAFGTALLAGREADAETEKLRGQVQQALGRAEAKRMKDLEEQLGNLQKQADERKKTLDALLKEDVVNKDAIKTAAEKSQIAKDELSIKRQELEIQKEINQLKIGTTGMLGVPMIGDMMSMMNEVRMIRDEAALSQFKLNNLDPSNMLSSAGRAGLAANEFNTAISTSNYQRDSLKKLTDIARNTKSGKVPTYF
jgi:hypothetical protein